MEDPGHTQQRPGIGLGRVCAEHRGRIKGREHQLNPGASSGVVLSSTSLGAAARTESQVLMGLSVPLHDGELGTGVHTPVAITGQSRWPCGSSALGCLPEGNGQLAEVSIWQRSCCMMRPPRPGNTAPPSRPRWMQHEVAQGPHRYGWNHRVGFCAGVDAPQVGLEQGVCCSLIGRTHRNSAQLGTAGSFQGKVRGPLGTISGTGHRPIIVG